MIIAGLRIQSSAFSSSRNLLGPHHHQETAGSFTLPLNIRELGNIEKLNLSFCSLTGLHGIIFALNAWWCTSPPLPNDALFSLYLFRRNSFGHRQIGKLTVSLSPSQQADWLVFLYFYPITLELHFLVDWSGEPVTANHFLCDAILTWLCHRSDSEGDRLNGETKDAWTVCKPANWSAFPHFYPTTCKSNYPVKHSGEPANHPFMALL